MKALAAILCLVVQGPLWSQVSVGMDGGRVVYTRPDTDPAFHGVGIGLPPAQADLRLWYAYDAYIRQEAAAQGVDPVLVKALIWCESRFHWRATSGKHARGLMQVMDGTAQALGGVNDTRGLGLYDPIENIRLGVAFLARLQSRYGGNLIKITAAYNAGPGAVDRFGGIPPYQETKAYVPAVLQLWARINAGR